MPGLTCICKHFSFSFSIFLIFSCCSNIDRSLLSFKFNSLHECPVHNPLCFHYWVEFGASRKFSCHKFYSATTSQSPQRLVNRKLIAACCFRVVSGAFARSTLVQVRTLSELDHKSWPMRIKVVSWVWTKLRVSFIQIFTNHSTMQKVSAFNPRCSLKAEIFYWKFLHGVMRRWWLLLLWWSLQNCMKLLNQQSDKQLWLYFMTLWLFPDIVGCATWKWTFSSSSSLARCCVVVFIGKLRAVNISLDKHSSCWLWITSTWIHDKL